MVPTHFHVQVVATKAAFDTTQPPRVSSTGQYIVISSDGKESVLPSLDKELELIETPCALRRPLILQYQTLLVFTFSKCYHVDILSQGL